MNNNISFLQPDKYVSIKINIRYIIIIRFVPLYFINISLYEDNFNVNSKSILWKVK